MPRIGVAERRTPGGAAGRGGKADQGARSFSYVLVNSRGSSHAGDANWFF